MDVLELNEDRIFRAITRVSEQHKLTFSSLLDIGSANRPLSNWFSNFRLSIQPRAYMALEVDPALIERLKARNLEGP